MNEPRYKLDSEIEAEYRDFDITDCQMYSGCTGGFQIEFPHRESIYENFIQYDNGQIAFDNWYPQEVVMRLREKASEMILAYKEGKNL